MRVDLWKHLAGGALSLVGGAVIVAAYRWGGPGPAAAATSTWFAIWTEAYQWVRKEGTPAWDDAAATAAPGWVAWLAIAGMG